jgi:hypothetical protein
MAAEGTEISKVRTFAGANLIWSLVTTAVWSNIVQADEVVERVGPEPCLVEGWHHKASRHSDVGVQLLDHSYGMSQELLLPLCDQRSQRDQL